jgi:hypothetical protein
MLAAIVAGVENVGSSERPDGSEFSNEIEFRQRRAGRLNSPARTCKGGSTTIEKIVESSP